ncbi:MipA/OmpV family protein [Roseomonas alkaliterrae]|uniref:Outer membrane scaffolding protein for murein synthesis (MipA/OmpV family) n=1 Tax=Neoroseomonas alkaliterrae TaxID=1452450 RepID=A0A840Y4F4_9PROT|nr:MipA/OmpV family protein [Neoroseomonas alkaliterrae]MBB5689512.1 outer membrane scaffolding protein for murein synthesis (MipA/OmpV family) [Neoroseomonas alkaliterrae]MBR0676568.1 MipA/OmpV family protein [Neoroseomonas alkaliterrae]
MIRRFAALLALAAAWPAQAQQLPVFEAGIAAGGGWLPAYPASDQNRWRGLVVPYVIYRGDLFRADDTGLRARANLTQGVELSVSASAGFNGSSRDIVAREGMPDLDWLGEIGPTLRFTLWRADDEAQPRRILLDTPVRAVFSTDWSSVSFRGFTFAPDIAYEHVNFLAPFARLRLSAGVVFGTDRYTDYFYRVDPEFARPGRPAYDGRAGYVGSRVSVSYRMPVNERVSLVAGGRIENFSGAANADSPLFRREWNVSVVAGIAVSLWRSEARVDVAAQPFD